MNSVFPGLSFSKASCTSAKAKKMTNTAYQCNAGGMTLCYIPLIASGSLKKLYI